MTSARDPPSAKKTEVLFLGGGCFWCLEAVYQRLNGVQQVVSGYMGGHIVHPSYEAVCGKKTGHAEVVSLTYQPELCPIDRLLDVFFLIHDPTTVNRQGDDIGPQYRSTIFATSEQQVQQVKHKIDQLSRQQVYHAPIVTDLQLVSEDDWQGRSGQPQKTFWPAEEEHQNYFRRHPYQGYCVFVVNPKLQKALGAFRSVMSD